MPPGPGNELGHWEPIRVAQLHDDILSEIGSSWRALSGPDEAWFQSARSASYVEKIKALIRSEYLDAPLIVVKDPRLSLLFPLWARALDDLNIACKPIIALRNPVEVAKSLCMRERREGADDALWRIDRAGLLALHYNLSAERWTRSCVRAFCDFDDLLDDWRVTTRRIGAELGLKWPNWSEQTEMAIDAFLRPSHRHQKVSDSRANSDEVWAELVAPVYLALRKASLGHPVVPGLFDQIRSTHNRALQMFVQFFNVAERQSRIIEDQCREVQNLKHQVALLTASTSWRMTAPLRSVVKALRILRGGVSGIEAAVGAAARPFKTLHIEPAE